MQDATDHELDARLEADTIALLELPLSRLLLMNDRRWPWLILVPRRAGAVELFDLSEEDRQQLDREACRAAEGLKRLTGAEKMNIATLGNSVRQFHLHVVARRTGDPNWPRPVWGYGEREPYSPAEAEALRARLLESLS
ncbi:HIT family protein [Aureimonas ureilytica]|uniref:HIT family protein n=1 Tax=Aureimonas ureilytica TaxID=401562 RepID=UPI000371D13F|nr:HIT family protein [Aureimonas ureilytica]